MFALPIPRCRTVNQPGAHSDLARPRLDLFETATAELPESPGRFTIVPGGPDRSELIRRVTANNPISIRDFWEFSAFFGNANEPG